MNIESKINSINELSENSPVLAIGIDAKMFENSTIINADIPSKDLGIVNTKNGLKSPLWFYQIAKGNASHQIVINNIDVIEKEEQEKFYEILKYKTISNVKLPADCKIIVLANDLKKVSETIIRLCLLVE